MAPSPPPDDNDDQGGGGGSNPFGDFGEAANGSSSGGAATNDAADGAGRDAPAMQGGGTAARAEHRDASARADDKHLGSDCSSADPDRSSDDNDTLASAFESDKDNERDTATDKEADVEEAPAGDPAAPSGPKGIFDMEALQKRMDEVRQLETNVEDEKDAVVEFTLAYDTDFTEEGEENLDEDTMRLLNEEFDQMDVLYVILFNANKGSEGVYSLALNGVNIVLAFQEKTEARRYALMLEAQEFPAPHVGEFSAAELKTFCGDSGFRLGLVPKGSLLTPPEETVLGNLEEWSNKSSPSSSRDNDGTTLDPEEVELMKRRLESLFGES
jgi:Protein of unknown function (DUF3110)